MRLDPNDIIRGERQRKDLGDLSGLKHSITTYGQLNPVIVQRQGDGIALIAGERRTQACLELGIQVEVKFMDELSPAETQAVELEENVKRKNLDWREHVAAVTRYHRFQLRYSPGWSVEKTANALGMSDTAIYEYIDIQSFIERGDERVASASGVLAARNIVSRIKQRQVDNELSTISELVVGEDGEIPLDPEALGETSEEEGEAEGPSNFGPAPSRPAPRSDNASPILVGDFAEWVQQYSGPKFNFAHCDFPYGVNHDKSEQGRADAWGSYTDTPETYKSLCSAFTDNADRFLTPRCHVLFWFSMNFYEWTRQHFERAGFDVQPFPLIWHKTDNKGLLPDPTRGPRRIYETAFLISRGDRKIIQAVGNCYGCPTQKVHHQSEKPEPMLRHFFRMLVDEFSEVIDPTAGSGSALRAAASLGAKRVFGLELNPEYAEHANQVYLEAQTKARASERIV